MLQEWTGECPMVGLVMDPNAQIAGGNDSTESREELRLRPHNVGNSTVGGISRFNVPESYYRAISTSTTVLRDHEPLLVVQVMAEHTQRDHWTKKSRWHRGK